MVKQRNPLYYAPDGWFVGKIVNVWPYGNYEDYYYCDEIPNKYKIEFDLYPYDSKDYKTPRKFISVFNFSQWIKNSLVDQLIASTLGDIDTITNTSVLAGKSVILEIENKYPSITNSKDPLTRIKRIYPLREDTD